MLQIEFIDPLQVAALKQVDLGPVIVADNSDLDPIAERLAAVFTAERADGASIQPDSLVAAYFGLLEAFSFALDLTEMPRISGHLIASLIPLHYWQ